MDYSRAITVQWTVVVPRGKPLRAHWFAEWCCKSVEDLWAPVTAPGRDDESSQKKSPWAYVSLGLEFAVTVGLLTWAGCWADQRWGLKPWGTVAGAMLGVVLAMYRLIRETAQ